MPRHLVQSATQILSKLCQDILSGWDRDVDILGAMGLIHALCIGGALLSQTGDFPDIVKEDGRTAWVYESILNLREAGMLVGYPDYRHGRREINRYEAAVATHATADFMHKLISWIRERGARI